LFLCTGVAVVGIIAIAVEREVAVTADTVRWPGSGGREEWQTAAHS